MTCGTRPPEKLFNIVLEWKEAGDDVHTICNPSMNKGQVTPSNLKPNPLPALWLMALVMGVSVANTFYAQSLLASIESYFGIKAGAVMLGPMAIQLGMAMGYLLLIPLGDGMERRRLLTIVALGMSLGCGFVVLAPSFQALLLGWFFLGFMALIPAMLPSFLTAFTPEAERGRMLGIVISGQFCGILLSRTVSGLAAEVWGWRSIYALSGVMMAGVALLIRTRLPLLPPSDRSSYWSLQLSMVKLWRQHALLRRSCITQTLLFGSFMSLWSTLTLHLATPPWRFGPAMIGSLGLIGLTSIVAAPFVGRVIDRCGSALVVTCGILCTLSGIFLLLLNPLSIAFLAVGLMAVDLGVQSSFVANQARIYSIDPNSRSRMSSQLFLTCFLGASLCSLTISFFWNNWHWFGTCLFALSLVTLAFIIECRANYTHKQTPSGGATRGMFAF
jgi:predicted MFS family arabinose efflux permease